MLVSLSGHLLEYFGKTYYFVGRLLTFLQRTIAFSALALKALALPQAGYIIGSPIMETTSTSMTMTTSTSTSTGVSMSTGTGLPGSPSTGTAEGSYKCYRGTDFPAQSEWLSFNDLLAVNQPTLQNGNTPEIYNAIVADIQSVASAAQIPPYVVPRASYQSHSTNNTTL